MKKCPRCNKVFDDALIYCANDGTVLIEENLVLPSESSPVDDEETLIQRDSITINIPNTEKPTEEFNHSISPPDAVVPVIIEKQRNTGKYLLFLITGLILGGGLVLATFIFAWFLYQDLPLQTDNTANRNSATETPDTPQKMPEKAGEKHEKSTDFPNEDFNGRVITLNAYIRSAPDRGSEETDVLPVNDRLDIVRRENENSPWYFVTCEHGTSGWMHGNTIEFTQ
jgi:hypothetical protein